MANHQSYPDMIHLEPPVHDAEGYHLRGKLLGVDVRGAAIGNFSDQSRLVGVIVFFVGTLFGLLICTAMESLISRSSRDLFYLLVPILVAPVALWVAHNLKNWLSSASSREVVVSAWPLRRGDTVKVTLHEFSEDKGVAGCNAEIACVYSVSCERSSRDSAPEWHETVSWSAPLTLPVPPEMLREKHAEEGAPYRMEGEAPDLAEGEARFVGGESSWGNFLATWIVRIPRNLPPSKGVIWVVKTTIVRTNGNKEVLNFPLDVL